MAKKEVSVDNVLIPAHKKLTEAEKKEFLKKYDFSELPKILLNDAMVKKLGAKLGDIIKIERNSVTAGKSVYYRGVING